MSNTLYAYMAGLIDGEGCINITDGKYNDRPGKHYQVRLFIGNTDRSLMLWLQQHFGGRVNKHQQNIKWKPCYTWTIISKKAYHMLTCVYKYLVIKQAQAGLAIVFQRDHLSNYTRRKPISNKEEAQRQRIVKALHKLNMRGT